MKAKGSSPSGSLLAEGLFEMAEAADQQIFRVRVVSVKRGAPDASTLAHLLDGHLLPVVLVNVLHQSVSESPWVRWTRLSFGFAEGLCAVIGVSGQ